MILNLKENYLKELISRQNLQMDRLSSGNFSTLDEYRFVAGKRLGLLDAEILFHETINNLFKGEKSQFD